MQYSRMFDGTYTEATGRYKTGCEVHLSSSIQTFSLCARTVRLKLGMRQYITTFMLLRYTSISNEFRHMIKRCSNRFSIGRTLQNIKS